jgi:hypothetical protein
MEGSCSTGQIPQRAVVPVEEELALGSNKMFLAKVVLVSHFVDMSASCMEPEVSVSSSPDRFYVTEATNSRHCTLSSAQPENKSVRSLYIYAYRYIFNK